MSPFLRAFSPSTLLLGLLLTGAASAQARRVVMVCPATYADGLDAKLKTQLEGWLQEAIAEAKVARVDAAALHDELANRGVTSCPEDDASLKELAETMRASHALVTRLGPPVVVRGFALAVEEGRPRLTSEQGAVSSGKATEKGWRDALAALVNEVLPPGEDLLMPIAKPNAPVDPPVALAPSSKPLRFAPKGLSVVTMGAGAALALAGGASFFLAAQKDAQFDAVAARPGPRNPTDRPIIHTLQTEGAFLRTIGTALLAAGGAGAVLGVGLGFTRDDGTDFNATIVPTGLLLTGRF